jgi:HEAT repeat protein
MGGFGIFADLPAREGLFMGLLAIVIVLFIATLVFSAYAIVLRFRSQARDRRRAANADKWRNRLLLALVDGGEAKALQESIEEEERLPFVGFVVQYARRVRGEEREALARLVRPFLGPIAERAESDRVEIRARAIQTLGTLGLPDYAARVIAALDDPSPLVAMVAARTLALTGSHAHARAVLQKLPRFSGWNKRFLASMLAAMGPAVAPALRDGLSDERADARSRAVLAEALHLQGDPSAADVAAAVLATTSDRELLASVLRLLRDVGRPEHAEAVRAHVHSPDPVVRAQALRALGAVGDHSDIPCLVEAMRDSSPWAALHAAEGVRAAGGERVLAEIAASRDATDALGVLARQVLVGAAH